MFANKYQGSIPVKTKKDPILEIKKTTIIDKRIITNGAILDFSNFLINKL